MSTRTEPWSQGTPSWADLGTKDIEKAQAFYGALFGWTFVDQGPDFGHYRIAHLDGRDVVGAMQLTPEQDFPPSWTPYLAVDDADRTAEAVTAAGGQVLMPVMDIGEAGRMLIAMDPTGGALGFWQNKEMSGTSVVDEPGAVRWNQLVSTDPAASRDFFSSVLGVTHSPIPEAEAGDYTSMDVDGRPVAGISAIDPSMPEGTPSHWQIFFQVEDAEKAVARIAELGGTVLSPVIDSPYGRMAFATDDQGVPFAVNDLVGAAPPQ